jgi:signal transduction histidine kinase
LSGFGLASWPLTIWKCKMAFTMRQIFNYLFVPSEKKTLRILHLGVLLTIILVITVFYYLRYFGVDQRNFPFWNWLIIEFYTKTFGILFVIPLIYAAIFLGTLELTITWLVCGLLILPRIIYFSPHLESFLRAYLYYTLPFFTAMFFKTDIGSRKMQRRSFAEKAEQRQKYLLQVFNAHEIERKNIARELHDDVIQSLIVLTNQAQNIITNKHISTDDGELQRELNAIFEQITTLREMSREISKDIRNICLNLRPYIIDDMGIIPAVRWLINRFETDTEIALTIDGIERRFGPETELLVYRILQEAINNIRRHSSATQANIHFKFYQGGLKIFIEDNGQGFILPEELSTLTEEGKLGLVGMYERVKLLNGTIKINPKLGQGTSMMIDAPIE